jgi:amino acid transporter
MGLWHGLAGHVAGGNFAAIRKPIAAPNLLGALSVCLWNYMGWDNASTIAQEVENPQRNYPRAMLIAAGLAALTYVLPLAAVAIAGIPAEQFSTGSWVESARHIGGAKVFGGALALAIVAGGMISGVGMFNALMMSYTRIPFALAKERLLPRIFARTTQAGVPWASVLLCAVAWGLAVQMSFERLISIDLVLYGCALLLEFVALVVLRVKEPRLVRPFRMPGGLAGAVLAGVGPAILLGFAMYAARDEKMAGMPALAFAALLAAFGPVMFGLARWRKSRSVERSA